jgi:hypothetical protein
MGSQFLFPTFLELFGCCACAATMVSAVRPYIYGIGVASLVLIALTNWEIYLARLYKTFENGTRSFVECSNVTCGLIVTRAGEKRGIRRAFRRTKCLEFELYVFFELF